MRAAALWLAIWLALAAILTLPLGVHAAPPHRPASLIVQGTGSFVLYRIYASPCLPETEQAIGVTDSSFFRRALVVYSDKAVEACWHTDLSDGKVTIFTATGNRHDIPMQSFRPERKA
jgi:hypothetical protein